MTSNERAKKYIQSRKAYHNKRLSCWLTPDDFNRIDYLKKYLHRKGLISKPTQESVIRYILRDFYLNAKK